MHTNKLSTKKIKDILLTEIKNDICDFIPKRSKTKNKFTQPRRISLLLRSFLIILFLVVISGLRNTISFSKSNFFNRSS